MTAAVHVPGTKPLGVDPYPSERCPRVRAIHEAARRGELRHLATSLPDVANEVYPPLRGADYVPLRWRKRDYLDLSDARNPARQIPHARKAIERAKAKAGLFAHLRQWPTPEERVAKLRSAYAEAKVRDRAAYARQLRAMRSRLLEIPPEVRRAVLVAWAERSLPCEPERFLPFVRSYLEGGITPVAALMYPTRLLVVGCGSRRDPSPERMPVRRRFPGPMMDLAASLASIGKSLSITVITSECGPLHTWEQERSGVRIGPEGPTLSEARAAELAEVWWGEIADGHIHDSWLAGNSDPRPPYELVYAGGGELEQRVVAAWEDLGVFRGAPVVYLPMDEKTQVQYVLHEFGLQLCDPSREDDFPRAAVQLALI